MNSLHVGAEVLLVAAAIWAALLAGAAARTVGVLLAAVAVPASLGVVEYSGIEQVAMLHSLISRVVEAAVIPALGWAFWRQVGQGQRVPFLELGLVLALLVLLSRHVLFLHQPLVIGATGMALALWAAVTHPKREVAVAGVAGFGLIVAAGLVIGTQGTFQGIARVDLFHFALASGLLAIGVAVRRAASRT